MWGTALAARGTRLVRACLRSVVLRPTSLDLFRPLDSVSALRYGLHTQHKCGQEIEAQRCLGFFSIVIF